MKLAQLRRHLNQAGEKPVILAVPAKAGSTLAGGTLAVTRDANGLFNVQTSADHCQTMTDWLKGVSLDEAARNCLWAVDSANPEIAGSTPSGASSAKFSNNDGLTEAGREELRRMGVSDAGLAEAENLTVAARR